MSDVESEPKVKLAKDKVKRKCTEEQLANLRKGMVVMKEKREKLAKEREEVEKKKAAGELPPDAPLPKLVPKPKGKAVTERMTETRQVEPKPRKSRAKNVSKDDLEAFKTSILSAVAPQKVEVEKVVEKPVEKVVERVVQKERIMTGSELLNAVFKF